jgi:hypothetical protein
MARLSPVMGAMSATVPIAAIAASPSVGVPWRSSRAAASLYERPAPVRSGSGYAQSGRCGSTTAIARGRSAGGRW